MMIHHNNIIPSKNYVVVALLVTLAIVALQCRAFSAVNLHTAKKSVLPQLQVSKTPFDVETVPANAQDLDQLKADLVKCCQRSPKPSLQEIRALVEQIEDIGEQIGVGQASSTSGLLSGDWELVYAPEDVTRSSPFFWAFRKAFPDSADQIFSITDAIPAPVKEVGPAYQTIDLNDATQKGRFVSRVKVATLGGVATSIMTTKAAISKLVGLDGIQLEIETTKPEESTVIQKVFGPLGAVINENAPAFPSGDALEQVRPGSSTVIMRNSFVDEGLRISRYEQAIDDIFVWKRREFASFDYL